jgi:hypothetical protein
MGTYPDFEGQNELDEWFALLSQNEINRWDQQMIVSSRE